jgi:Holliday junction resolvase
VTKYTQGRQFEYDVRDDLISRYYYVMRSAGSKGILDLIAMGGGEVLALQLKVTDPLLSPLHRQSLISTALLGGAVPLVAYKATDPDNPRRKKIFYRQLTGPGPKDWAHWAPGEDD